MDLLLGTNCSSCSGLIPGSSQTTQWCCLYSSPLAGPDTSTLIACQVGLTIDTQGSTDRTGTKSIDCSHGRVVNPRICTHMLPDWSHKSTSALITGRPALLSRVWRTQAIISLLQGAMMRKDSNEWGNSRWLDSLAESSNPTAAACSAPCIVLG